jgi:hypothetical protein
MSGFAQFTAVVCLAHVMAWLYPRYERFVYGDNDTTWCHNEISLAEGEEENQNQNREEKIMREFIVSVRPFSGTLQMYDPADTSLSYEEYQDTVQAVLLDGDEDEHFVMAQFRCGQLHSFHILDCKNGGSHWNLWASAVMDDETIQNIFQIINTAYSLYEIYAPEDDLLGRMSCRYETTLEVK